MLEACTHWRQNRIFILPIKRSDRVTRRNMHAHMGARIFQLTAQTCDCCDKGDRSICASEISSNFLSVDIFTTEYAVTICYWYSINESHRHQAWLRITLTAKVRLTRETARFSFHHQVQVSQPNYTIHVTPVSLIANSPERLSPDSQVKPRYFRQIPSHDYHHRDYWLTLSELFRHTHR